MCAKPTWGPAMAETADAPLLVVDNQVAVVRYGLRAVEVAADYRAQAELLDQAQAKGSSEGHHFNRQDIVLADVFNEVGALEHLGGLVARATQH